MRLEFDYTEADFDDFLLHYSLKGRGRRLIIMLSVAMVISMAVLLMQNSFSPLKAGAILVTFIVFGFFWRLMLKQMGKRSFRQSPQLQEPRVININEEGLTVEGTSFDARYNWSDFNDMTETKRSFLLYTAPMSAVILPKRAFSEADLEPFRKRISGS